MLLKTIIKLKVSCHIKEYFWSHVSERVCQSVLCCAYRVNYSIKYIRQGLVLFVYVFVAFLAQSPETTGDGGEC